MKVKEFAESQGVSVQAVYQRINGLKRKTGKPLSAYIEPKTNELTGECLTILEKLYSEKQQIKQIPVKQPTQVIEELKATIKTLDERCKSLESRIESKDTEIKRLENQVSDLKNDKSLLSDQITELRNDKQFLKELAENLSRKPKQGFLRRLFSGEKESH